MPINLKNIPLFRALRQADLDAIANKAVVTSVHKNAVVITEGKFSQLVYFILSGTVIREQEQEDERIEQMKLNV